MENPDKNTKHKNKNKNKNKRTKTNKNKAKNTTQITTKMNTRPHKKTID
jgi:hypothetical protein